MAVLEVLFVFLRLGLTSFGGPAAHLSYFRRNFVEQRGWLAEADYASLVALCQFLPGPGSSQTGFGIGMLRAGWLGGIAAFLGFTLPSATLMFAIALRAASLTGSHLGIGVLHGLQIGAIAVVAQAVHSMARTLCPGHPQRVLAVLCAILVFVLPASAGAIIVIAVGGLAGRYILAEPATAAAPTQTFPNFSYPAAIGALILFFLLLALSFIHSRGRLALFNAFYRTGALVFGGGHVILPLLQNAIVQPGWVPAPLFLAGYGAAQTMPGPLFTFGAFLGTLSTTGAPGLEGALIALTGIFLPGLLLTAGILPFWPRLHGKPWLAAILNGVNAAVVGLLAAALIGLLTNGTLRDPVDILIAAIALALLTFGQVRPLIVVGFCAAAGAISASA